MQSSKNRTDFCPLMEIASKNEGSCYPSSPLSQSHFAAQKINIRRSHEVSIDFSVRILRKDRFGENLKQVFPRGTRVVNDRIADQHIGSQHFEQKTFIRLVIGEEEIRVEQVAQQRYLVSRIHHVNLLKTIDRRHHCVLKETGERTPNAAKKHRFATFSEIGKNGCKL